MLKLVARRYRRMLVRGEPAAGAIAAYILARIHPPCVLIGDELVHCSGVPGNVKHAAAVIEGRAMLAVNGHVLRDRPELVVLHACALSIAGRAAVIVGPTTSGKSTTALALLLECAEALPLSDEFALINKKTMQIEAFPRLFAVRAGARRLLDLGDVELEWDALDPGALCGRDWAVSARRVAFFFIEGRANHAAYRPMHLSEALFIAVSNVLWPRRSNVKNIRVVDEVLAALEGSRLYALTLGPPRESARLVRSLTIGASDGICQPCASD